MVPFIFFISFLPMVLIVIFFVKRKYLLGFGGIIGLALSIFDIFAYHVLFNSLGFFRLFKLFGFSPKDPVAQIIYSLIGFIFFFVLWLLPGIIIEVMRKKKFNKNT